MMWKRLMFLVVTALLMGLASASIMLTGTTDGCTFLRPGHTKMFILGVEEPQSGTYLITLTSDGLYIYPKEIEMRMEANETYTRWIKVTAPVNVYDKYYTLQVAVYDTNGQLIELKEYCFHAYKGILESKAPDVVLGYKDVNVEGEDIVVTLYVKNLGKEVTTVTLDSDYGRVEFSENPVVVYPYRTVFVKARLPADVEVPEYVTFYGYVGGNEKKITVKMPAEKVIKPSVDVVVPSTVEVRNNDLTIVSVIAKNSGKGTINVRVKGKGMPIGVSVFSDVESLAPGQEKVIKTYIVANDVLRTGTFVSQICLEDEYGAELVCRHTVLKVLPEAANTEETPVVEATPNGIVAVISVNADGESYYGVEVKVDAPEGRKVEKEPSKVDLEPYEEKTIKVTFVPTTDAKDGKAVIKLVAPDGTVIAQKVVELKKSAITGYATLGTSSIIGLIIAAIVIAIIVAAVIKKGREVEEVEEELEELTRKE